MSSKKLKPNDENLCPIASKRSKSTESPIKGYKTISNSAWIAAKLQESTSSPSGLSNEYLEEMGVGLLDSDESSSSAASTINFAVALSSVSSNADENCNEATPNLDAPKFLHQQRTTTTARLSLDQTINSLDVTITSIKQNDTSNGSNNNNNNDDCSTSSFAIFNDEESEKKSRLQHKTLAILADSPNGSVLGSGHKRSPLATVVCNNQSLNTQQQQQQFQQVSPNSLNVASSLSDSNTNTPNTIPTAPIQTHIIDSQVSGQQEISLSPQQPMTSHQAALLKQQQQQGLTTHRTTEPLIQLLYQEQLSVELKHQNQQQKSPQTGNSVSTQEEFFVFRNKQLQERQTDPSKAIDYFNLISDEIVLQIFKWLPKKTLLRCGSVCRRFYHCAADESLWTRLDLGSRSLRPEVIPNVLMRGVVILRLAQTNFREPVFPIPSPQLTPEFQSKLQFLDLSLAQINKAALKTLLSHCRQLKKLSLEHVPLNNDICNEIAENTNLETLNLAMCTGLEAWSIRKMFKPLKNLTSLNISWTNLSVDAVTSLVTHVTSNLIRLNISGCRKTMFDTHVASLAKRCPQLLELDLSDCTGLTGGVICILADFKELEYLSLSRCYLIPVIAYLDLQKFSALAYIDVFGTLSDDAIKMLERSLTGVGINKFVHSSVARPTVGTRRTSIWGLRTRD